MQLRADVRDNWHVDVCLDVHIDVHVQKYTHVYLHVLSGVHAHVYVNVHVYMKYMWMYIYMCMYIEVVKCLLQPNRGKLPWADTIPKLAGQGGPIDSGYKEFALCIYLPKFRLNYV